MVEILRKSAMYIHIMPQSAKYRRRETPIFIGQGGNNHVYITTYYCCTLGFPELAGTIAVFSKEGALVQLIFPPFPPSGAPGTVSAGGKTAFSELHRHWYCQIIIKYL